MVRFPSGLRCERLRKEHRHCHAAPETFAFVAVILDCIDESAKKFYQRWDFREVPGRPMRLFLPYSALEELMSKPGR